MSQLKTILDLEALLYCPLIGSGYVQGNRIKNMRHSSCLNCQFMCLPIPVWSREEQSEESLLQAADGGCAAVVRQIGVGSSDSFSV